MIRLIMLLFMFHRVVVKAAIVKFKPKMNVRPSLKPSKDRNLDSKGSLSWLYLGITPIIRLFFLEEEVSTNPMKQTSPSQSTCVSS